jgi:DNA-binding transcriptional regulator YiaG
MELGFQLGKSDDWWTLDQEEDANVRLWREQKQDVLRSGHATKVKQASIQFTHALMLARNKLQMTQAQFGKQVNISAADIHGFETGKRVPSSEQRMRMNHFLHKSKLNALPAVKTVVKG